MTDSRRLMSAALLAGIPSGLLYGVMTLALATPVLFSAEALELGSAAAVDRGFSRTLWTIIGSVGLATGLALLLTPVIGLRDRPRLGTGLAVGIIAFLALIVIPGLLHAPAPPGVEHLSPVGHRQGAWLMVALCVLGSGAAAMALFGSTRSPALRRTLTGITGAAALGAVALLWFGWQGAAPGHSVVPATIIDQFRHAGMACNLVLFLALSTLIPPALRRWGG